MAIFHLSARSPISRAAGRSVTAAAAYRSGVRIVDERTGLIFNYSRRKGVVSTRLVFPSGQICPDRADFWNRVERHHRRGDAVLGREVVVALPAELQADQRERLAMTFAAEIAERFGVAADCAVHEPSGRGDDRNHHAHILLSACLVESGGALGKKCVELDPIHCRRAKIDDSVAWLRPRWADMVNRALAASGEVERVDHRSNEIRGIATLPTVHIGVGSKAARHRSLNRKLRERNERIRAIDLTIDALEREHAFLNIRQVARRQPDSKGSGAAKVSRVIPRARAGVLRR
jgi:hypothetical protein